jgi:hypothetical protein
MDVPPLPPGHRICTICGELKPLEQFRFASKSKGIRHPQCRPCATDLSRFYYQRNRRRELRNGVYRMVLAKRPGVMERIAKAMVSRFGGPAQLAEAWLAEMKATREWGMNNRFTLASYVALLRMLELTQKNAPPPAPPPDLSSLGPDQVDARLSALTLRTLQAHPEIALAGARKLGWIVIPPAGSEAPVSATPQVECGV